MPRRTAARRSACTRRTTSRISTTLRALLEGSRRAAGGTRIAEEEVDSLRESCDRFDASSPDDDLRELVRENLFFHSTILDIAGSARLAAMVRG